MYRSVRSTEKVRKATVRNIFWLGKKRLLVGVPWLCVRSVLFLMWKISKYEHNVKKKDFIAGFGEYLEFFIFVEKIWTMCEYNEINPNNIQYYQKQNSLRTYFWWNMWRRYQTQWKMFKPFLRVIYCLKYWCEVEIGQNLPRHVYID